MNATRIRRTALKFGAPLLAAALVLTGCGLDTPRETITPSHPMGQQHQHGQSDDDQGRSEQPQQGQNQQGQGSGANTQGGKQGQVQGNSPRNSLTAVEAARIAEGVHDGARAVNIDLDRSHGITVWEVDVVTRTDKYEIEVNAATGEVVQNEHESDDVSEYNEYLDAAKLSYADAIEVALGKHPNGIVVDFELDEDDHVPIWEIEVMTPGRDTYDMEINAVTGEIYKNSRDD